MADINMFDDPIWDYVMGTKLTPYIPAVRKFWENIEDIIITGTGIYKVEGDDVPPGLMYRVTNTPVRSPIKHVQVFPFVTVPYLQLTNVAGGANRMVSRVCENNRFTIEEFTIIEKHNLPSTYHKSQFVAFVPTDIINGITDFGKWIYFTHDEMMLIAQCDISPRITEKCVRNI